MLAGSRKIQSLAVFTGSALGKSPIYEQTAENFARTVAGSGRAIVYGGGRVGLMGTIADAARAAGGEVFGVMPQVLVDGELAHPGLTSLEVVPDMHARKHRMSELADGFVALPGGAGTLEELFEVWTWQQLGIHAKPVALLNVDGFWQPLLKMLDHMTNQGFLAPQFRDSLVVASEPNALLDALSSWKAPAAKWGASSKN
ncbi:TIGR00730 family Rossman fold protein [Glutamicibacter sp. M10]|nr:TIGR00730 family Rossman fold protein [Arthrobacter sp. S41]UXN33447.1 TIGR00730 family Rossman fold protein [Glutamicibacter sp. M10]